MLQISVDYCKYFTFRLIESVGDTGAESTLFANSADTGYAVVFFCEFRNYLPGFVRRVIICDNNLIIGVSQMLFNT